MTTKRAPINRFDLTVWAVSLTLIAAIVGVSVMAEANAHRVYIAYLSPAYGGIQDIWITPLDDPDAAEQLTNSSSGIFNFGVSQDGRKIAYADRDDETGLTDIFLLDLQTRQSIQLTNCAAQGDDCKTPVFHPNDQAIAYERMSFNRSMGAGPGAIRIWLLDLTTPDYTTRRLFDDSQIIGHSPQWSGNGDRIAFYNSDIAAPGVIVYDFGAGENETPLKLVPSNYGSVGSLSPNGQFLVFPEPIRRGEQVFTYLQLADLAESEFNELTGANDPVDDIAAQWHPDGQEIVMARRYTDDRWTAGHQLYTLNIDTGEVEPLVVDERYSHGFFAWDEGGERLLMQRFPLLGEDGEPDTQARPEIWVYDRATNELTLIAKNVFFPRWITP